MFMPIDDKCTNAPAQPDTVACTPEDYAALIKTQESITARATEIFEYAINPQGHKKHSLDYIEFQGDTFIAHYNAYACGCCYEPTSEGFPASLLWDPTWKQTYDTMVAEEQRVREQKKSEDEERARAQTAVTQEARDRTEYRRLHEKFGGVKPAELQGKTLECIGQPIIPVETESGEQ
jgi:hypothetical protein